jgi:hypothetical protein
MTLAARATRNLPHDKRAFDAATAKTCQSILAVVVARSLIQI